MDSNAPPLHRTLIVPIHLQSRWYSCIYNLCSTYLARWMTTNWPRCVKCSNFRLVSLPICIRIWARFPIAALFCWSFVRFFKAGKQGTFLIAPSPASQSRILHPFIRDRLIDFIHPSFLTHWKGASVSSFHLSTFIQTHPSGLPFPSQPATWRSTIHAKRHHAPVQGCS